MAWPFQKRGIAPRLRVALIVACGIGLCASGALMWRARHPYLALDPALRDAAFADAPDAVAMLLDRGAHVEAADARGWTALAYAAGNGSENAAKRLLEAGAKPTTPDPATSPLLIAVSAGDVAMVSALVAHAPSAAGFNEALRMAGVMGERPVLDALFGGDASASLERMRRDLRADAPPALVDAAPDGTVVALALRRCGNDLTSTPCYGTAPAARTSPGRDPAADREPGGTRLAKAIDAIERSAAPADEACRSFLKTYYEAWSSNRAEDLAFVWSAYGESVGFYGKTVARDKVLADKKNFVARWPERRFSVVSVDGVATTGSGCTIDGVIAWETKSLPRRRQSTGKASIHFAIDLDGSSRISEENGRTMEAQRSVLP